MRIKEWLQDNRGFSLIEVVLAVAILALVTLPIMNYFTYSSQQTFEGRDKQTANLVAETVLEDLNSYNNYEQIEKLGEEDAWNVDTSDITCTKMDTTIENNGREYKADVKVNYDEYDKETKTVDGDEIDPEFNDYEIPQPSEIYSSENIVASEDDQLDEALSEFYLSTDATVPKAAILNVMDRTICIKVTYASSLKDLYRVQVYYDYTFQGETFPVHLEDREIEVDKLENIFVFYNLHRDGIDTELLSVNFGSDIPDDAIKEIKIYYACQKSDTIVQPTGYKLSMVSTDARASLANFYTNVEMTDFELAKKEDGTPDGFVSKETSKRIAMITVEVTEVGDNEVLATLTSTKAE